MQLGSAMTVSGQFGMAIQKKVMANSEEQGRQAVALIQGAASTGAENAKSAVSAASGVGTRLNVRA